MSRFELIFVPNGLKSRFRASIDQLAPSNWQTKLEIVELKENQMRRSDVSTYIVDVAGSLNPSTVLLCKGIAFEAPLLFTSHIRFDILEASANQLLQPNSKALQQLLAQRGLDNESSARDQIARWVHSDEGASHSSGWVSGRIENWRRQFYRFDKDNGLAVANALLYCIEIMSTSHVAQCIKSHGIDTQYGFAKDAFGKSWGVVLNALVKTRGNSTKPDVLPLHEAIQSVKNTGLHVRVVEDGLFSATEVLGVIESLMGYRSGDQTSHKEKTPPLLNPEDMYVVRQEWVYGCVTDYGQYMFHAMTKVWGFQNLNLSLSADTKVINVLNGDSIHLIRKALAEVKTLPWNPSSDNSARRAELDAFRDELNKHVVPCIATILNRNCSQQLQAKTLELCANIGEQLWMSYLQRAFGPIKPERWSEDRIRRCALGKDGLGLAFSFAHSIPKTALPILWAKGRVKGLTGEEFDWIPLFPNAE